MSNSTKYKLYIAITLAICIAPFVCMSFAKTDATAEKKTLASWPELTVEGKLNSEYLPKMGEYFEDHFAFKEILVSINAHIHAALFNVSSEESVILGKNGWLFYSATEDDYAHNNSVSERELFAMARNMKLMQDYCEYYGSDFIFTIAPNKNSLYPENMPDRYKYQVAEKSDAERLKPYLSDEGVHYVDLFELFNKQDEVLYLPQDSHWNNKGADLVYNTLLDEAGILHERFTDAYGSDYAVGDLAGMLYSVSAEPEENTSYIKEDHYEMVEGSSVEDSIVRTVNETSPRGSLLMYRDSFGNSLIPFFANAARDAYFSKIVPYPLSDLEITEPDIVIVEKVERHLPTLAQVPPTMEALEVTGEEYEAAMEAADGSDECDCDFSDNDVDYIIEGRIMRKLSSEKTRVFVRITDEDYCEGGQPKLYEAFLTCSSKDIEYKDQGFLVYIPSYEKMSESAVIDIIIEDGGNWEIVATY